jgi:PAS domain-containing protein
VEISTSIYYGWDSQPLQSTTTTATSKKLMVLTMSANNNDIMVSRRDGGSPLHNNAGNGTAKMVAYEKTKCDIGSMDDFQFNASLDALLYSENLEDTNGSTSFQSDSMAPISIGIDNAGASSQPAQGLLTSGTVGMSADTSRMVLSRPGGFPYSVTTSNQSDPDQEMAYMTTPMQGSVPFSTMPLASQYEQLIMPTPFSAAQAEPALSSADVASLSSMTSMAGKRTRDATAVSEDEEEGPKRRQDRNLREQQRSHKITHQIDHLRDVLASANVPFKPDKYSTLVSVADYIKQLQSQSSMLDVEHKKLIDTISRTNEMAKDQYVPASTNGENPPGSSELVGASDDGDDSNNVFGIDYKTVFSHCEAPLSVLSIDGRFLDCNGGFEHLTGYSREELLPCEKLTAIGNEFPSSSGVAAEKPRTKPTGLNLSLFNLLSRDHMENLFLAMSEMLKHTPENEASSAPPRKDYWTGCVYLSRDLRKKVRFECS